MKFHKWKNWVNSLPLAMKWFVCLILIRPFIDNLYYLKDISIFYSPLYIIGMLTPALIFFSFLSRDFPSKIQSNVDKPLWIWGSIILMNSIVIIFDSRFNIRSFEILLKVTSPIYLYFYLRHFIRTIKDLEGLLQTFLYSAIFPFAMILYEYFVSPIGISYSRGIARFQGAYADIFNYGIYISLSFLIAGYFFLKQDSSISKNKKWGKLIFISCLVIIGLLNISHLASTAVFLSLLTYFMILQLGRRRISQVLFLLILVCSAGFFMKKKIVEQYHPLIEREVLVLQGKKDVSRAMHGRVWRWSNYYSFWKKLPALSILFGASISISKIEVIRGLVLISPHNDFIRIILLSGVFGLIVYLIFLLLIYLYSQSFSLPEKYLLQGALLITILYSITAVPTIYFSLMYIILSIFAYAALKPQTERE